MKKTLFIQYCERLNKEAGYELTQVKDMSNTSMSFTSSRSHKKGEILDMSINLPNIKEAVTWDTVPVLHPDIPAGDSSASIVDDSDKSL